MLNQPTRKQKDREDDPNFRSSADVDARPWDFQAEECSLRASVDRFNTRRYSGQVFDPEYKPVDNCYLSVMGQSIDLSDEFKQNYGRWLEEEVFSLPINWDQVLSH